MQAQSFVDIDLLVFAVPFVLPVVFGLIPFWKHESEWQVIVKVITMLN
jgi:hypothetical protein